MLIYYNFIQVKSTTPNILISSTPTQNVKQINIKGNELLTYPTESNFDLVCQPFKTFDKVEIYLFIFVLKKNLKWENFSLGLKKSEFKTSWIRKNKAEMPSNFMIEDNVLQVRDLKESDADMYECIISFNGISENIFVVLNVTSKQKQKQTNKQKT